MVAHYSLDNAISSFFESNTSATRQQCDDFAQAHARGRISIYAEPSRFETFLTAYPAARATGRLFRRWTRYATYAAHSTVIASGARTFLSTFNSAVIHGWLADQPSLASSIAKTRPRAIPTITTIQATPTAPVYACEYETSLATAEEQQGTMVRTRQGWRREKDVLSDEGYVEETPKEKMGESGLPAWEGIG